MAADLNGLGLTEVNTSTAPAVGHGCSVLSVNTLALSQGLFTTQQYIIVVSISINFPQNPQKIDLIYLTVQSKHGNDFGIPKSKMRSRESQLFSVLGPRWWNEFPPDVRIAESLTSFHKRLKTHLFRVHLDSP